ALGIGALAHHRQVGSRGSQGCDESVDVTTDAAPVGWHCRRVHEHAGRAVGHGYSLTHAALYVLEFRSNYPLPGLGSPGPLRQPTPTAGPCCARGHTPGKKSGNGHVPYLSGNRLVQTRPWKSAHSARPPASQVHWGARRRPAPASRSRSAGSAARSASAPASAAGSSRGTTTVAPPPTSTSAGASELTTGTPAAIASSTGSPNPSARLGAASAVARDSTTARSASGIRPSTPTRPAGTPSRTASPSASAHPH